jgi:Glycogen debranching enzyme, glucanotransferase domain
MPGLRILNIHPRLAGPLSRWRALLEIAADTGFNMVWLNPFHRTTEVAFDQHGARRWRSLYSIADHDGFDAAITSGDPARDRAELVATIEHARARGLRVMVDLVVNHVAVDHRLVRAEDEQVRAMMARPGARVVRGPGGEPIGIEVAGEAERMEFLFQRDERLLPTDFEGTVGYDNAQILFDSPAARRFFLGEERADLVEGEASLVAAPGASSPGRWNQLIDFYLELGVSAFRCDMAHNVPASWWRSLIAHARSRNPEVVFLAETLGGMDKNLRLVEVRLPDAASRAGQATGGYGGRPAFELVMLSIPWWDMKSEWLLEEIAVTHHIALHGGAAFPDSHDLPHTQAQKYLGALRKTRPSDQESEKAIQEVVAALCVRDYAMAALAGSSVITTLGYLYCLDQSSVFWDPDLFARLERTRQERADLEHPLNLRERIASINGFLARLPLPLAKAELDGMPRDVPCESARGCELPATPTELIERVVHDAGKAEGLHDSPGLRECLYFEVLLRHAITGRPLGRISVGVDRSYEAGGPELARMMEFVRRGPAPGLRRAILAQDEAKGRAHSTTPPGTPNVTTAPEPGELWLETPLLVARFVPAPPAAELRGRPPSEAGRLLRGPCDTASA